MVDKYDCHSGNQSLVYDGYRPTRLGIEHLEKQCIMRARVSNRIRQKGRIYLSDVEFGKTIWSEERTGARNEAGTVRLLAARGGG